MIITDEQIERAKAVQDTAHDIIRAAQLALLARGVSEADEVVSALLGAAWHHHKEMIGLDRYGTFAALLRDFADSVDRASVTH